MGGAGFQSKVQESRPTASAARKTQQARIGCAAGLWSINLDLIYGCRTRRRIVQRNARPVLEMKPDRLAVFSYAHVPWVKPAQKSGAATASPLPKPSFDS